MARTKIDLNAQALAGSLSSTVIADSSIVEAKIGSGAVTEGKIGLLAVTEGKIGASAVTEGKIGAAAVTATKIGGGAISDSHVNAAAAIAYGKLALSNSIVNADVASGAAIAYSKLSLANSIVDADLAGSISDGKLATPYIKADGTRAFSGAQSMGGFKLTTLANGTDAQDAVTKAQLDAIASTVTTFEWQPSVLSATLLTPPGSPSLGDRYLINGVGTDAWASKDNNIAEWNGSAWVFTPPVVGMFVSSDAEGNKLFLFGGSLWETKYFESTTASTGLVKTGFDIQIASSTAGNGLTFNAGVLAVGAGSAINANADSIDVKYDASTIKLNGSNQLYVDQTALTAVNAALLDGIEGASLLRSDADDSFTGTTLTISSASALTLASGSSLNVNGTFNLGGSAVLATAAQLNSLGTIVNRETPSPAPDGVSSQFTLANTPKAGSEMVYLNGILQDVTSDYTIAGGVITFLTPLPQTGDKLRVSYRY